jgi:hypothetical protein
MRNQLIAQINNLQQQINNAQAQKPPQNQSQGSAPSQASSQAPSQQKQSQASQPCFGMSPQKLSDLSMVEVELNNIKISMTRLDALIKKIKE